jgi:predicted flap endonuclease-1-like 5' DNA nuclease
VVIAFVVGLVVGLLITWFYWQQQVQEHEDNVRGLRASLNEKEQSLQDRDRQMQDWKSRAEESEAKIGGLQAALGEKEQSLQERDSQMQDWKSRAEESEAKIGELQAALEEKEQQILASPEAAPSRAVEPPVIEKPKPDNLKRIEGIGPKTSQVLQDAGIMTFAQLAAADVSRLEQILKDAGMTLADPGTWPEQASLAAAGNWQALDALQDELAGGRRD